MPLMNTAPASRSRTKRVLLVRVGGPGVGAQAERGALASSIASSRSAPGTAPATGPKTSSSYIAHVGREVGDHGRRVEPAGPVERARRRTAPWRPCADRVGDLLLHVVAALLGGQRADVGASRPSGRRPPAPPSASTNARGELVVDVGVHDEALGRDAGLPVVLAARGGGRPWPPGRCRPRASPRTGRCRRAPARSSSARRRRPRPPHVRRPRCRSAWRRPPGGRAARARPAPEPISRVWNAPSGKPARLNSSSR